MGRHLIVGVLAAALLGACSILVDTSGLTGGPGGGPGVLADGGSSDGAGPGDATTSASSSSGGDGPDGSSGGLPESGPITDGSCTIPFVQAVPATSTYQVIQQAASQKQLISATAGNLLVAIAYGGQNPGQSTPHTTDPNMTFDVTDSRGNTYYPGPMFENALSNQSAIQIFYAANVAGGSTVVTAASAAPSGITLWTGLFLQEYSGVATTDVVDISVGRSAPSSSMAVSPGAMTTSRCSLVVGAFVDGHVDGQTLSPGDGWIFRSTDEWDPGAAVDNSPVGSATGTSVNALMNLSTGADTGWVATQMAFRAAGTTPPPQPTKLVFTNAPLMAKSGACAELDLATEDAMSAPVASSTGARIPLSTTGGTFYADSSCAYPITSVLIGAGTSNATVYFKPTATAASTVTVTAAPSNGLAPATQSEQVTSG